MTDDKWAYVVPYLTQMDEDGPRRHHDLCEAFNALRWLVRAGSPWRFLPNDLPPWAAVYQRTQRWLTAESLEPMADDLRALLHEVGGRKPRPTAVILDGRTLQSTPESGHRAGCAGHKKRKGSKLHAEVDTFGYLLAAHVTPANEQARAQVATLLEEVRAVTGNTVKVAFVDQGYTGSDPIEAAADHGIELVVVSLPRAKKGFVLLPRRWAVERSFAWATRFRRQPRITSGCRAPWSACISSLSPASCFIARSRCSAKAHNVFLKNGSSILH